MVHTAATSLKITTILYTRAHRFSSPRARRFMQASVLPCRTGLFFKVMEEQAADGTTHQKLLSGIADGKTPEKLRLAA